MRDRQPPDSLFRPVSIARHHAGAMRPGAAVLTGLRVIPFTSWSTSICTQELPMARRATIRRALSPAFPGSISSVRPARHRRRATTPAASTLPWRTVR